jgi:hypothetical protein
VYSKTNHRRRHRLGLKERERERERERTWGGGEVGQFGCQYELTRIDHFQETRDNDGMGKETMGWDGMGWDGDEIVPFFRVHREEDEKEKYITVCTDTTCTAWRGCVVVSCHVTSCHVMSCDVMSCHVNVNVMTSCSTRNF